MWGKALLAVILVLANLAVSARAGEFVVVEKIPANVDRQTVIACILDSLDFRGWKALDREAHPLPAVLLVGKYEIRAAFRVEGNKVLVEAAEISSQSFQEPAKNWERYLSFVRDDVQSSLRMVSLSLDAVKRARGG